MVEKLLTNWMSICLYTFVRVREAEVEGLSSGAGRGGAPQPTRPPAPTPSQPAYSRPACAPSPQAVRTCILSGAGRGVLYPSAPCLSPVPGP